MYHDTPQHQRLANERGECRLVFAPHDDQCVRITDLKSGAVNHVPAGNLVVYVAAARCPVCLFAKMLEEAP